MTRKFSPWAAAVAAMLATASMAAYADSTTANAGTAAPVSASSTSPAATAPAPPPPPPPPPPAPTPSASAPTMVAPPAPQPPPKPLVAPPGVAATIDGHVIKTAEVDKLAYQIAGSQATQQLINFYLIETEANKDGVTVSDADIQKKIDEISQRVAPMTLDQALKQHNMTLGVLTDIIRHNLMLDKCSTKDIQPIPMVHVHHILIKVAQTPASTTASTTTPPSDSSSSNSHTDAEALAIIQNIQTQLKAGKSFEDLAKQYSEDPSNKDSGGDLPALVYTGSMYQPSFVSAAIALKKGEITQTPAKSSFGYHLIECISTSSDHPASEDKMYDDAETQYIEQQAATKSPALMQSLIAKAKIVNYVSPQ